ncbi:serine/threonine transporter SstT [Enterococcus cecorum]|uniref:Serine/threonine transporter SstT n=1 Tax=Enterococcus cecorum TaxID=44008 RepID=A0A7X9NKW4_9ENTE|nr:serine/threonine transporter SstT [Enterococcus cecorum]NME49252.1 serine/threonine transporter SstT [Enterococcus cecorum]
MIEFLKDLSLLKRIAIGIILGIICGICLPHWTFINIFGSLFVGALKAIAPILVFVLILASISQHNSDNKSYLKPVITLYLTATLFASVVAVFASFLFPVKIALQQTSTQQAAPQSINEVLNTILTNIVQNPLQAMIEGNYLAVLFWSALIGFALRLASPAVKKATQEIAQAITLVVQLIIAFAPLGIFGLVFQSVATTGLQYGQLLLLLVGSMFFVALVVYPIMVFFLIRENPYPLVFYCLKNSAIPAFFTRSSAANIPINMLLAKNMGLTESAYSISLPLGATINMGGAAITISTMTLAAVHTLDMQVSPVLTLILCILSALSACGASGIAGGSLLLIPLACSLFGISNDIAIQVVGVGFIIGVVQDAIETAVNSSSDILFTAAAEFRDLRINNQDIHLKERLSK